MIWLSEALSLGAAAWRLAHMLFSEDGPFDLFSSFRKVVFSRFGQDHWISRGVDCVGCLSFWSSFLLSGILHLSRKKNDRPFVLTWFSVAGVAFLLHLFTVEKES